MKKSELFGVSLPVIFIVLMSCHKENQMEIYEGYSLVGKWHLASYGGGIAGQFENYNKDIITWTFDTINNQVQIKNKRNYFGPNMGTYPYELRKNEESEILYLNDSLQGILYINEQELLFNHAGLWATFKRQ
jgi:hypothetical protein